MKAPREVDQWLPVIQGEGGGLNGVPESKDRVKELKVCLLCVTMTTPCLRQQTEKEVTFSGEITPPVKLREGKEEPRGHL